MIPHNLAICEAFVKHEVCHALGAIHEHLRPDSGLAPHWKDPSIMYGLSEIITFGGSYQSTSIMHYNRYSYHKLLKNPDLVPDVPFNYHLTERDKLDLSRAYDPYLLQYCYTQRLGRYDNHP